MIWTTGTKSSFDLTSLLVYTARSWSDFCYTCVIGNKWWSSYAAI